MFECCCTDGGGKVVEILNSEDQDAGANAQTQAVLQPKEANQALQSQKIEDTRLQQEREESLCKFTATISKGSLVEPLGLTLTREFNGQNLVVRAVLGRAVEDWNMANPGRKVSPGDQIVAVNGITGDADTLIDAMKTSTRLVFELVRETIIRVSVKKDRGLGLKLNQDTLEVVSILEGMIMEHNKAIQPTLEVYPGDKVHSVNGVRGSPEEILGVISNTTDGETLELVFTRAPVT